MPPGLPPLHGPCRRVLCNSFSTNQRNGDIVFLEAMLAKITKIPFYNVTLLFQRHVGKCDLLASRNRPLPAGGESKLDSLTVCNSSECLLCRNCPKSIEMSIVYRARPQESHTNASILCLWCSRRITSEKSDVNVATLQNIHLLRFNYKSNYKSNSVGVHRKLLSCKSG